MPNLPNRASTSQRLLEAATQVFAEHGFRDARIRDICKRAQANVAAVNYHYRDKEQLYRAVIENAFSSLSDDDPIPGSVTDQGIVEQQIYVFVRSMLGQLLGEGQSAVYAKLVARELVDPTTALDQVIDKGIAPQIELLCGIIRSHVGRNCSEQAVRRSATSILGQCLFYYFARPVIDRLQLERDLSPASIDEIAKHITQFTRAALSSIPTSDMTPKLSLAGDQ